MSAVETVVMLFMVLTAPNGTKQSADVAVVRDGETCSEIARALNSHPERPPELAFLCRPIPKVVRS
jgi:hypothetical protein